MLTGSAYEESSFTIMTGGIWGGVFTRGISTGIGFVYPTAENSGAVQADMDGNKLITIRELFAYCKNYAAEKQNVQVYPEGSSLVVFDVR